MTLVIMANLCISTSLTSSLFADQRTHVSFAADVKWVNDHSKISLASKRVQLCAVGFLKGCPQTLLSLLLRFAYSDCRLQCQHCNPSRMSRTTPANGALRIKQITSASPSTGQGSGTTQHRIPLSVSPLLSPHPYLSPCLYVCACARARGRAGGRCLQLPPRSQEPGRSDGSGTVETSS